MALPLAQLRGMSDDDLIRRHDEQGPFGLVLRREARSGLVLWPRPTPSGTPESCTSCSGGSGGPGQLVGPTSRSGNRARAIRLTLHAGLEVDRARPSLLHARRRPRPGAVFNSGVRLYPRTQPVAIVHPVRLHVRCSLLGDRTQHVGSLGDHFPRSDDVTGAPWAQPAGFTHLPGDLHSLASSSSYSTASCPVGHTAALTSMSRVRPSSLTSPSYRPPLHQLRPPTLCLPPLCIGTIRMMSQPRPAQTGVPRYCLNVSEQARPSATDGFDG